MQLKELLQAITYECVQGDPGRLIADICYDSNKVRKGSLFVCIKGQRANGHDYLLSAVRRGAAAVAVDVSEIICLGKKRVLYAGGEKIVIEQCEREYGVVFVFVRDTRLALAQLSAAWFGHPAKKLRMVGITGTKGKTTTAFMAASILAEAGHRVGMIGTVFIWDGRKRIPSSHTTPESCDLQRYLAQMVENGCDCCVMEVSSQGLKMQRVAGIFFDIGVFLNIEPDHIGAGEHASFSEYLCCKAKLFSQCSVGIVNADDLHAGRILRGHTCSVKAFSMHYPAQVTAEPPEFFMESGRLGSRFTVWCGAGRLCVRLCLPGVFNVYNALAAVAVAEHFFVTPGQICRGLERTVVPGRCENTGISEKYVFLIDYAHNEMSLKNLLETLRVFSPSRLVVIFGCGGNRSLLRRTRMGEMAGHLADFSVLTSDNPRWEDPDKIIDDIESGIRGTGGAYVRIPDRAEAVRYAVERAAEGDIIVLAGKGHEDYQEICGVKYPMQDQALVADAAGRLAEKRAGRMSTVRTAESERDNGGIRKSDSGYLTGQTRQDI